MKKLLLFALAVLLTGLWLGSASAAIPDPQDSIILESKAAPDSGALNATDTAAILYVRVWITNKESLTNISLPVEIRSLSNNAFGKVGRPRNFNGTCNSLTATLASTRVFAPRINSVSPDSATWSGFFDPLDDATLEPPNASRVAFWDLKFDSLVIDPGMNGQFEMDSIKILSTTVQFVNRAALKVDVNFVKSVITVQPSDVQDIKPGQIPREYALSQNYPNPFNANTQIRFALPKAGNARLDIYNVLGQKVGTLFNEFMNAGSKTVNWDGRADNGVTVPSGVYFYQLVSQEFRQTKKMLLIK